MSLFFTIFRRAMQGHMRYVRLFVPVAFLLAGLWIAEPLYARYAVDRMLAASGEGEHIPFLVLFGIWLGILLLMNAANALAFYVKWSIQHDLLAQIRQMYYERALRMDISHHVRVRGGELMKKIDNAADAMVDLTRQIFLELVPASVTAIFFVVISFTISWQLALVILCLMPVFGLLIFVYVRSTRSKMDVVNALWVHAIGRGYDALTNIFSVKSSAAEERELTDMRETHERGIRELRKVNISWSIFEGIGYFALMRVMLIGIGIWLLIRGELSLGSLFFFQFSFFRMVMPLEMLGNMMPRWNELMGKVRLAEEVFSQPMLVQNKPGAISLPRVKGHIEFRNISFSYERIAAGRAHDHTDGTIKADTLNNINLTIEPGQHIALVGHSGAGKSTIAMLLNRFYDVTGGAILIDGTDLRDMDVQWWRGQIGLVLQENIMFNDTVLENIRYSRPDASDDDVIEAAKRASAHDFIERLPNGYDTLIGERGIRLSGGERQRVAIARAILKQPAIVILDEATSALDSVTEKKVQEGIQGLVEGRTSVIIAHRLSTVRSVDRIAVMEGGRVTAFGPHDELMRTSPVYCEMVELQHAGILAE